MRILTVSIACPPKNDPESLQLGKYVKYLSKNHDIEIVTSSHPTLWMNQDDDLKAYLANVSNIVEVDIWEPKYLSIIANKWFRKLLKPDSRYTFYKKSKEAIDQIEKHPSIIYSRSFPLSSTLMAEKLVERFKVPWILHLSDPWVESPLYNYDKSKYHKDAENRCFEKATKICFTSQETIDLYVNKYPHFQEKFVFFPNVFDEDDILDSVKKDSSTPYHIVYTGSLIESRSLKTILLGIDLLDAELKNQIKVTVAGSVDSYNQNLIDKHSKIIDFVGFMPFHELTSLYRNADLLIAVDFNFTNPKDGVYFPSKLLDYFAAQKEILAITSKNSTTEKILRDTQHTTLEHGNTLGVKQFLIERLNQEQTIEIDLPLNYSAETNAKRLEDLMKKLCQD